MKTIKLKFLVIAALIFIFAAPTFAVENLQLSIQASNAILAWPSSETNGETFIVQYRQTLSATDSWQTLTDYLSAATDTNLTFFIHSNSVQYPLAGSGGGTNGGGGVPSPGDTNDVSGGGTNNWSVDTGFYRVVRDGVHIYGLTNGMVLNGEVQLPIEFALDSTDEIVGVTFYDENSSPIIGASAYTNSVGRWILDWNTTMSFNGDYNIYAELDFASDEPVVSAPVTLTVDNMISFPNYFSRIFGDQMWVYAETIPDAAYEIDMFDENSNSLGAFTGNADGDGVISFYWDLTDGDGHAYDSTNFYGTFIVDTSSPEVRPMVQVKKTNNHSPDFLTPTGKALSNKVKANGIHANDSGSSASAPQMWVKEPQWTPNNNWVVAYGLFNNSYAVQQDDINMITGGPAGEYGGVLGTLDQYGLNGNLSPGNSAQGGTVFTLQDQSSRTDLLGYLADHRYENFYFFGHGNSSAIGAYNGYFLTYSQIAYALVNVPLSYTIIHAAEHPYRFVMADGCDTGAGNLCEAFAIPAITTSTNFFKTAGVESRAFVGFKSWKVDNISNFNWENYSGMTSAFLATWLSGQVNLETCVYDAQNNIPESGARMDSSAIIYEAADMYSGTITRPLP